MPEYDSPLTEEVLKDVAQTFFGARKRLDDMIDILEEFARILRKKAAVVERRAGLLHYLLVTEALSARFYEAIGAGDTGDLSGCRPPDPLPPRQIPFAVTGRGRFVKMAIDQYGRLQQACREYQCSSANPLADVRHEEEACVDARLVKAMWELVNRKIREVNEESSPSTVLQYAKGLDARGEKQSRVAGATAGEYEGMDQKYVYRPIPLDQMGLRQFPDLPKPDSCRPKIKRFCKSVYPQIREEVGRRLRRLKTAGEPAG
jgi:hypothetical protein